MIAMISALTDTDINENVFTLIGEMVQQMRLQSETTEGYNHRLISLLIEESLIDWLSLPGVEYC